MHVVPPPNPRELLPPLLACLPLSFVSPQAPPALLPLLAPVLRQRVSYLATSPTNDGWLSLLSWQTGGKSSKLPGAVERMELDPHPVSGEIEIEDTPPAKYKRLDEETLHARLEVEQFDLSPTYVWCESDEHGGTGPGWKLADLKSLEDLDTETKWYDTTSEAEDAAKQPTNGTSTPAIVADEDDANDDYWAAYDRTPGATPARSPAPAAMAGNRARRESEDEYYSRYGEEVQPSMDSHDPDEDHPELGESTLTGDALVRQQARSLGQDLPAGLDTNQPRAMHDSAVATAIEQKSRNDLSMPRPISPTSSQGSIEKLEQEAAAMSAGREDNDRASLGIKQHISTDIKSLFRLAKSAGMARSEFERIVKTELEVLPMLDDE